MDSNDMHQSSVPRSAAIELWSVFSDLSKYGKSIAPRGQIVREIENFTRSFSPYVRYSSFEARKFKLDYLKREMQWYLAGYNGDPRIDQYAKTWADIRQRGKVNSNYGQYLFTEGQLDYVVRQLVQDPDSRRASVVILQPKHLHLNSADTPCTYSMNFRLREGQLNCSVHMRSQDAIFGMGNDLPTFSFIQEIVAANLMKPMGPLHMHVDSFHVYERHFDMLRDILEGGTMAYQPVETPKIGHHEARWLLDWWSNGPPRSTAAVPCHFTTWLLEAPL